MATPPDSPWFWGILYGDPRDPRVIVPSRFRLGWTFNWTHPRVSLVLAWLLYGWVGISLSGCAWFHRGYLMGHGKAAGWLVLSVAGACVAFLLNGFDRGFGQEAFRWGAYGILAALAGFGCQSLLNGLPMRLLHPRIDWTTHLYLGPMAALCQTLGKLLALAVLARSTPEAPRPARIRQGLIVGLGFALTEIVVIMEQVLMAELPRIGLWGSLERFSSSLFHVCSTGLLAVAWADRRRGWLWAVWVLHGFGDWMVGANATLMHWPAARLEAVILALGLLTWMLFLRTQRLRPGGGRATT